jgi:prevent-host-death family protein
VLVVALAQLTQVLYLFIMEKVSSLFSLTASAAEVARNFGRYKELAQRGAVAVTSHGRDSIVLVSVDEYVRLKALDNRVSLYAHELSSEFVKALDQAMPPETTKAFNHELTSK